MNYELMIVIVVLVFFVQGLRYLLFEQQTVSRIWRRFDKVPLLGTFLNCAFCQGFWIGFLVFWGVLGLFQAVVWGFMSAWISATWDKWARAKESQALDKFDDCPEDEQTVKKSAKVYPTGVESELNIEGPFNDMVSQLDCNIDDMSGEFFGDLLDRLFGAGAVDVWFTPVYGKKNRPLYQLSALVPPENEEACIHVILEHSSSGGLRRRLVHRVVMDKSFIQTRIQGENVAVKKLQYKDIVKYSPEWEDCAAASKKLGLTAAEIYAEAQFLARKADGA